METFSAPSAPGLDGKTGSWEVLIQALHIWHEETRRNQAGFLGSGIANFIGLWTSLTNKTESIGKLIADFPE